MGVKESSDRWVMGICAVIGLLAGLATDNLIGGAATGLVLYIFWFARVVGQSDAGPSREA